MGWSFSPDDVFDHDALSFAVLHDFPAGRAANVLIGESHDGHSTCAPVAGSQGLEFTSLDELL